MASRPAESGILTVTTDFGTRDAYVAVLKGTALQIAPNIRIVDISHDIAPQDVMQAAYVLRDAAQAFPPGTVHLAVVDAGVQTDRPGIALLHGGQYFVGPDNGLFSLVVDGHADFVVTLDKSDSWRVVNPSNTFHGRDIFAPVAARLAAGGHLVDVGTPTDTITPLHWALPISDDQGVRGWVVHIDRFGNCITNIPRSPFESTLQGRRFKSYVGNAIIDAVHTTYGSAAPGEPLLLFNSSDFLEVSVARGNAAELLNIRTGAPVNLVLLDDKD